MKHEAVLVGDVGGTHSRWAIFSDGELGDRRLRRRLRAAPRRTRLRPYRRAVRRPVWPLRVRSRMAR